MPADHLLVGGHDEALQRIEHANIAVTTTEEVTLDMAMPLVLLRAADLGQLLEHDVRSVVFSDVLLQ